MRNVETSKNELMSKLMDKMDFKGERRILYIMAKFVLNLKPPDPCEKEHLEIYINEIERTEIGAALSKGLDAPLEVAPVQEPPNGFSVLYGKGFVRVSRVKQGGFLKLMGKVERDRLGKNMGLISKKWGDGKYFLEVFNERRQWVKKFRVKVKGDLFKEEGMGRKRAR